MTKFFADMREFLPILLQGVWLTIIVTSGSLILSTLLGMVWALMRVSRVRALQQLAKAIVNGIRGIPIIVQLFYIYFVMPELGVTLSALQASIIGLGIAYSAYQAENFRAGIEAIDKGQIEASESLGMGWALMMRRVVLPQAVKIILPPYGNIMIMMLKDSSQASTITVAELTLKGQLIASSTFKYTSVLSMVAVLYLVMSVPLILFVGWLERRMQRARSWSSWSTCTRVLAVSRCCAAFRPVSAAERWCASSAHPARASRLSCAVSTDSRLTTAAA